MASDGPRGSLAHASPRSNSLCESLKDCRRSKAPKGSSSRTTSGSIASARKGDPLAPTAEELARKAFGKGGELNRLEELPDPSAEGEFSKMLRC
jgi:hypothetical protein